MSNVYVHFSQISFPARYSVVNFQLESHSLRFREVIKDRDITNLCLLLFRHRRSWKKCQLILTTSKWRIHSCIYSSLTARTGYFSNRFWYQQNFYCHWNYFWNWCPYGFLSFGRTMLMGWFYTSRQWRCREEKSVRISKYGCCIKPLLMQCVNIAVAIRKYPEVPNSYLRL